MYEMKIPDDLLLTKPGTVREKRQDRKKTVADLILEPGNISSDLKRREEHSWHMASIVESSEDAIISKSLDGIIISWNKGAANMFGYTAEEAIGKPISLIIPDRYEAEVKNILDRIQNNQVIDKYETVRNKKDGSEVHISLKVSALKDLKGAIQGISIIARDLTFRTKFEEELFSANKELALQKDQKEKRAAELVIANEELAFQNEQKEKRAAELAIANEELAFQNKEKEKRAAELVCAIEELESFSYSVSHDLRAPVRAVNGYTRMLQSKYGEQFDQEANRLINNIVDNAANLFWLSALIVISASLALSSTSKMSTS